VTIIIAVIIMFVIKNNLLLSLIDSVDSFVDKSELH